MKIENKRWIYLIAATLFNTCIGSGYAFSVFMKPLNALYGWTPPELAMAFTLVVGISALPMVLAGKAQQYFQPKTIIIAGGLMFGIGNIAVYYGTSLIHLYLWYGVLAGIGMGTVYSGAVTSIVKYFPDKRGLASGFMAAGFGSGAIIWAPVAAKLIESSGVLSTFRTLGIIYLAIICGLALLIEKAPEGFKPEGWVMDTKATTATAVVDKDWKKMLLDPLFYCIATLFVLGTLSGLMIVAHASPMMQWKLAYTPQQAAAMVGIIALFNTFGRIFWGTASDKIGRVQTMLILFVIAAAGMYGLTVVPANFVFVIMIMMVASSFGGFMAMIASITADSFGTKNLPINFGVMFLAFAVAAYYGPKIAGTVKMANDGDYSKAFIIAAVLGIVGIAVALVTLFVKKTQKQILTQ